MNMKQLILYLCGPMDFTLDNGVGWRKDITRKLVKIGLQKGNILDPSNKKQISTHPRVQSNEGQLIKKYKEKSDWKAIEGVMKEVVHVDLRMVDKSDVVVVNLPKIGEERWKENLKTFETALNEFDYYIDPYYTEPFEEKTKEIVACYNELHSFCCNSLVPTFGTLHEIVVARQQKKPVLLIYEDDLKKMSSWLMWLIGHKNIFHSLDECVKHIDDIMKGKIRPDSDDWVILE